MNLGLNKLKFSTKRRMDMIHQTETAECGLACVMMVANYHGFRVDITTVRNIINPSSKGINVFELIDLAKKFSLIARPAKVSLNQLNKLKSPSILHWDLDHFVVLKEIKGQKGIILDPAKGQKEMDLSEISKHYTGIAIELSPENQFESVDVDNGARLKDFLGNIKGVFSSLVVIFSLSIVLQAFVLLGPIMQQLVIDEAISSSNLSILSAICFAVFLFSIFSLSVEYIRSKVIIFITNTLSFEMGLSLYRHLMGLPINYFEKRKIGDIIVRFGSLQPIQSIISSQAISILLDGILVIFTLLMSFYYSAKMTLIGLGFILIGFIIQLITFPYIKRKEEEIIEHSASEQSTFLENVHSAITLKTNGKETPRENLWTQRRVERINTEIGVANFNLNLGIVTKVLSAIQVAIVLYIGAELVILGEMTLGMLIAYKAYSSQFFGKLSGLIGQYFSFKMLDLHLQKLSDIVCQTKESEASCSDKKGSNLGHIQIKNLSFQYSSQEPFTLKKLNFEAKKGDFIVVCGPSGSGKTTFLKCLLGVAIPQQGEIAFGGSDLHTLSKSYVRSKMGLVMQDDKLLSGTIADNISFFDDSLDFERMKQAAKFASIEVDIEQMPMKYDTLIGEMGSSLSGGQRQRILIARAYYKQPELYILDEGTANLDQSNEKRIVENLTSLDTTVIMVTHNENLMKRADVLYFLADGKLTKVDHKNDLV